VIHVNELISANPADVLLGDLYAEYGKAEDKTEDAIRRSRLCQWTPEQLLAR
jgi:hypothetical protein